MRMRVEISSSTAVGPDWRRLIGTLRSDWSTEAWLGCGETVASFDIAAAPSLVDRQAHAADGLLTSGSTPPPAFPERRFQWRCGGRLPGHSGEDRAGLTPASRSSVAWAGRYPCSTTRTKSSTTWKRSISGKCASPCTLPRLGVDGQGFKCSLPPPGRAARASPDRVTERMRMATHSRMLPHRWQFCRFRAGGMTDRGPRASPGAPSGPCLRRGTSSTRRQAHRRG